MSSEGYEDSFLRGAGGQTWLMPLGAKLIEGLQFNDYWEPFLGGGSIFFSIKGAHRCHLSDLNSELITTYRMLKDDAERLYREFRRFPNTAEEYYRVRAMKCRSDIRIAARFLYLNQTSFNGLYRVNKKGEYNVPYGYRKNWGYDKQRVVVAGQALNRNVVDLSVNDFETAVRGVQAGDLVFFDPPYTVNKKGKNGFVEYNETFFSLDDQRRLSAVIDRIKTMGAYYVLTNAAHPTIEEIFRKDGDFMIVGSRLSAIGGDDAFRGKISEYIFTNIPERKVVKHE